MSVESVKPWQLAAYRAQGWYIMKLSAMVVKNAKAADKNKKLTDGGGLHLLLHKNGSKYWRYDYRYLGKRRTLALGTYPEVSLQAAREAHAESRALLRQGLDPSNEKRRAKAEAKLDFTNTFESVAHEWYVNKISKKSASYRVRTLRILRKDLYPYLGPRPINQITSQELLVVLRRIEARTIDIAHRAKQIVGQIYRYGIAIGVTERNISTDLTGALRVREKKHHAAITNPIELGKLLVAIDGYSGSATVCAALKLSALLFQRPGEIRNMQWSELNWAESRWEIPAIKMKMRREHFVPLSTHSIALLRNLHALTGDGIYVFPSPRGPSRPLSDNGVRVALRKMGFSNEEMSPHGFRATARTILDEVLGYRVDWIEHQLAHAVKDPTGRAYNRTSFLTQRTEMMQGWADYLESLRNKAHEAQQS